MELIICVSAVCLSAAIIGTVIKKDNQVFFLLLGIASIVVVVYKTSDSVKSVINLAENIVSASQIEPGIISIILKITVLSIITKITSDICDDAGMKTASSGAEFAGSVVSVYVALPIINSLYEMIINLI